MSIPLNKYIGALITQITEARAEADTTAAQIAKAYANDELLKNFAIPRFRAQQVELTIPVALDTVDEKLNPVKEYIDNKDFNSKTYQTLKDLSKTETFDRKTSVALQKLIANESSNLELALKAGKEKKQTLQVFSKTVAQKFSKIVKNSDERIIRKMQTQLSQNLTDQIAVKTQNQELGMANVIVEASKLREINDQNLIKIKITLNEEGMEWVRDEDAEGNEKITLLPE